MRSFSVNSNLSHFVFRRRTEKFLLVVRHGNAQGLGDGRHHQHIRAPAVVLEVVAGIAGVIYLSAELDLPAWIISV